MEALFCVDCLEDALRYQGKPEIFNSDQGAQFTSEPYSLATKISGNPSETAARGLAKRYGNACQLQILNADSTCLQKVKTALKSAQYSGHHHARG